MQEHVLCLGLSAAEGIDQFRADFGPLRPFWDGDAIDIEPMVVSRELLWSGAGVKECQWLCDLVEIEAMYHGLARKERHYETWVPCMVTGHILSNRLWYQVSENR